MSKKFVKQTMSAKKSKDKPLTLAELTNYNQRVLFPAMEERFVTKNEFKGLKDEFNEFKNESLTNQDAILKKLDTLLKEKTVLYYQKRLNT